MYNRFIWYNSRMLSFYSRSINHQKLISKISSCKLWASCSICTQTVDYIQVSTTLMRKKARLKPAKRSEPVRYAPKPKKKDGALIDIWKNMTIEELATLMSKKVDHIYETLIFIKNSSQYDHDKAMIDDVEISAQVVKKSGMKCRIISPPISSFVIKPSKDVCKRPPADPADMVKRPAVVTIMGHVDHGKTTLLDCIRKSSVVSTEFGGITQHIGAFTVKINDEETITFLDTPGHAAFSAMRARGANVTDIVVLVVAADDGVMEQTTQSLQYAQQANVPIIVAINKIDKLGADVENCKQMLLQNGIQLEEFGGNIQHVEISALKSLHIPELIDCILTQAELMQLKGDPSGLVEGTVIESQVDPNRGKLATVLVERGTMRKGSVIVAGSAWAKVRAMFSENEESLLVARPSCPVRVIGWRDLPASGDQVIEVTSEKQAKDVMQWRKEQNADEQSKQDSIVIQQKIDEHLKVYKAVLEKKRSEGRRRSKPSDLAEFAAVNNTDQQQCQLPVVIKGDVNGSVEAILDVLDTYYLHNQCKLDIVHYGTGAVSENDVNYAASFNAVIYAFNVAVPRNVHNLIENSKIKLKKYNVIYQLIDDIKEEINQRLPLIDEHVEIGQASVLQNFMINEGRKKLPVAGATCSKGQLKKNALFKVQRQQEVIYDGELVSMRHLKNEVNSIGTGVQCGLMFADMSVIFQPGDAIICYQINKVPQKTIWDPGF